MLAQCVVVVARSLQGAFSPASCWCFRLDVSTGIDTLKHALQVPVSDLRAVHSQIQHNTAAVTGQGFKQQCDTCAYAWQYLGAKGSFVS
jgi:hypothetical protein